MASHLDTYGHCTLACQAASLQYLQHLRRPCSVRITLNTDVALQGGGVHGNAILSRYDMSDSRAVEHRCVSPQPILIPTAYLYNTQYINLLC